MNENQTTNTGPTSKELEVFKALQSQDVVKIKELFFPSVEDYSYWTITKQLRGHRTLKQPIIDAARKYIEIQNQKKQLERQLLDQ